jgi:sulfite dehydrogenase (cytochrome) subunit B
MRALGKLFVMLGGLAAFSSGIEASFAQNIGIVTIQLPPEMARLKPGPGQQAAQNACTICHSVDYIYMQPPLTKEEWHGEVLKMKKVMGAPIPDDEVDTIVKYLMSQNGKG